MSPYSESSSWETPGGSAKQLTNFDAQGENSELADPVTAQREQAIERIKAHKIHRFRVLLVLYLIVNTLLIATWALCAVMGWSAYFNWYILLFTIFAWGLLLVIVRRRAYQSAYTEEQIQREMQ